MQVLVIRIRDKLQLLVSRDTYQKQLGIIIKRILDNKKIGENYTSELL